MSVRYLTSEEKEMIATGLNMRKCYIETGTISLGAAEVEKIGAQEAKRAFGAKIKALSESQMGLILASNELVRRIYSDELFINDDDRPTVRRVL